MIITILKHQRWITILFLILLVLPPHVEYIDDYSIEAAAQLLDINYLDRHYKAIFKGPTRLIQV